MGKRRPASASSSHFQMRAQSACAVALKHWLRSRPQPFNCYTPAMTGSDGIFAMSLTYESAPGSDWSKLKGRAGRIICLGDDGGEAAANLAEAIVRKHLRLPKLGDDNALSGQ